MKYTSLVFLIILLVLQSTELKAQQTDPSIMKQRAAQDSIVAKFYNPDMAAEEMRESKDKKLIGYLFLVGGAGAVTYALTSNNESLPVFLSGCLFMGMSNPLLTQGSRSKGRSQIFSMDPQLYDTPEERAKLISKYKSTATVCTVGGWLLFVGGLATFTAALSQVEDNERGLMAGTGLMMASLPVWMVGSNHKGRVSVLTGKYPAGRNLSMVPAQRGIGVGIILGK